MELTPGTRLHGYEVTAAIGAGGMGHVYRARDIRLGRDVAIKVLRSDVAIDADRLDRFEREAQILASLNHPNIAAIYGVEDATGVPALVMELVDGPTLADSIVTGPIPIRDALPIARQIAEALEAAHEQGIIHRDLKPANIKVRPDGAVKVLDFGLAKAFDPAAWHSGSATNSPTVSMHATRAGIILGTAAYMAPEVKRSIDASTSGRLASFSTKCSPARASSAARRSAIRSRSSSRTSPTGRRFPRILRSRFNGCCADASTKTPNDGWHRRPTHDSRSTMRCANRSDMRRDRREPTSDPSGCGERSPRSRR
jgi:serine/threonine protein kinase